MSDRPSAEKIVEHLRKIQNDERVDFHARGYAEFGADEIERLRAALSASAGYLTNALIDLRTGAPKKTAINTIDGGLTMVQKALSSVHIHHHSGEKT